MQERNGWERSTERPGGKGERGRDRCTNARWHTHAYKTFMHSYTRTDTHACPHAYTDNRQQTTDNGQRACTTHRSQHECETHNPSPSPSASPSPSLSTTLRNHTDLTLPLAALRGRDWQTVNIPNGNSHWLHIPNTYTQSASCYSRSTTRNRFL